MCVKNQKVTKRLKDFNVTLNEDKCVNRVKEIDFLGHNLSEKGIKPTNYKLLAIKQFRGPTTAEEPLRQLTRKDEPFVWNVEQANSFKKLKNYLSNVSTLGYYDMNDRTRIVTDANPVGLLAVLVQFKGS